MSYTPSRLTNRITVGETGYYNTIKEAVDWFNASATSDTEILLDAGIHSVASTIVVDNSSYNLQIRGLGSAITTINSTVALSGSNIFSVKTNCDFNKVTIYGYSGNEVGIYFNTNAFVYSEITDIMIDHCGTGIYDIIGSDLFIYDFVISNCTYGIHQNYTGDGITPTLIDCEVGNITNCLTGIYLDVGAKCGFIFKGLIFEHVNGTDVGIKYNPSTYILNSITNINGCDYNFIGSFYSGFDFTATTGINGDVEVLNNVGTENKSPHCKINVIDNTVTTTITTGNTYYKLNGVNSKYDILFDLAATAGTFTISYHGETTGTIAYNASAATIKSALELLTNITTVTVTQITASQNWTIEFITVDEGWVPPITVNISGLTTTTSADVTASFYTCKLGITNNKITSLTNHPFDATIFITGNISVNQTNRNLNIGVKKNNTGKIIAPFTVRTATQDVAYPFALVVYADDVDYGDYFEIFSTSPTSGDVVRLWDLNMYISSR